MAASKVQLPERWINPEMLTWAREQVGLDVRRVADLTKDISEESVRAWEVGEESPTLHDLEILGDLYDCPVGYFFLEVPPQEKTFQLNFRGMAEEKVAHLSYESRRKLRQFTRLVDLSESLIVSSGLAWEVSVPTEGLIGPMSEISARVIKQLEVTADAISGLATDEEAFNLWRTKIEEQGVLTFSLSLDAGELRGASVWDPPYPPAILVNHADVEAASGRTFTLLHEYAHLLMRNPGIVCDFRGQLDYARAEQLANRFAAESLVPQAQFKHFLLKEGLSKYRSRWSDAIIDKLRSPFHASRDVIRILLEDLSYAPEGSYREWRSSRDKARPWGRGGKGGQTKAARRRREFGRNFHRILAAADKRGSISKLDLADILDMKLEHAEELLESIR